MTPEEKAAYKQQWAIANRDRVRENQRRWRQANRDRIAEYKRQSYLANREQIREKARQDYASDPVLRDKINRGNRRWREANRDRVREYQAAWYEANGENVRERVRRYKEENREAYREADARRYAANPEKGRSQGLKRRHGLDDVGWARMWAEQEGRCYLCERKLDFSSSRLVVVEHWHGCTAHDPEFSCTACRRGLACIKCNIVVGIVEDEPELLRLMADRLEAANNSVRRRQAKAPQRLQLELGFE